MTDINGANTCGTCKFKLTNPGNLNDVNCRRNPPQLVVIPVPGPMNQVALQPVAMYPAVNNKMPACGEYVSRMVS